MPLLRASCVLLALAGCQDSPFCDPRNDPGDLSGGEYIEEIDGTPDEVAEELRDLPVAWRTLRFDHEEPLPVEIPTEWHIHYLLDRRPRYYAYDDGHCTAAGLPFGERAGIWIDLQVLVESKDKTWSAFGDARVRAGHPGWEGRVVNAMLPLLAPADDLLRIAPDLDPTDAELKVLSSPNSPILYLDKPPSGNGFPGFLYAWHVEPE